MENVGLEDIFQFICEVLNDVIDEEGEIIVKKVIINVYVMGMDLLSIYFYNSDINLKF